MRPHSTQLTKKRWNVPGVGDVAARLVRVEDASEADRDWPTSRKTDDWHITWRWRDLIDGYQEAFAIVESPDDRVAALWCSHLRKLAKLRDGLFYRPDYLEVAPRLRGGAMGVFAFQVIAARALELGADGIVLATWPPLRPFYAGLGGTEGAARGWRAPGNLIPFTFSSEAIADLAAALETREK